MLRQSGSRQRLFRRLILTTTLLPAVLAVQAFGDVNWNGAVPLNTGDPGLDIVHVLGNSTVTLTNNDDLSIIENSISFEPAGAALTLAINGPGLELRSLATILSITNGKTITISGSADFAPGVLSTGPTAGTATDTGINLIKDGGSGLLLLDDLSGTSALAGTTLKVVNGTISILGGGGTINPVSTLTTLIDIGNSSATSTTAVLRIGSSNGNTTFTNSFKATQSGTLEHLTATTDNLGVLGTPSLPGTTFSITPAKTLTVNVAAGGLVINGDIADPTNIALRGGIVKKLGNDTTLTLKGLTYVGGLNAAEGRLEVLGRLRLNTIPTIGATAVLSLQNLDSTNPNQLPTTITVPTGTLEGAGPGVFGPATNLLNLTGGTLKLGLNADSAALPGLTTHLYNGNSASAQTAFAGPLNPAKTFADYASYFVGRDAAPGAGDVVSSTGAGGVTQLSFDPGFGNTPMFAVLAPKYTYTDQLVSRFNGRIIITAAGNYTFATDSDDGSMLFIDGAKVVSNNASQAHVRRTGTINLAPGLHDIDIGYYEGGGQNGLIVAYSGPDTTDAQTVIPNSVLAGSTALQLAFQNPVKATKNTVINATAASVPSIEMSGLTTADRTLTVNGQRLDAGVLKLTGGAGTYTLNSNTPYGQVNAKSIVDSGNDVDLVNHGAGALILESGTSPQLQNPGSSVTVDVGPLGLVRGTGLADPTGNATVNVNSHKLILSSKGGDQSFTQPAGFGAGGEISAQAIGSGVVGGAGAPIRTTLVGGITGLTAASTLTLSTRNNYILAVGGVTGSGSINVAGGAVESTGPINLSGTGNVTAAISTLTTQSGLAANAITLTDSSLTNTGALAAAATFSVTNGSVTANGSTAAGAIVVNNGTFNSFGAIATGPGGIQITGSLSASTLNLNGGAITGGPISVQTGVIHMATGVTTAATSATFTGGKTPDALKARYISSGGIGSFWKGNTIAGILAIETNKPATERLLTSALAFLPYQGADATISTYFGNAPTDTQFSIGFFGNFTAPVTGTYSMQVARVDDDAGFWIDRDGNGIFQTTGTAGNELISQSVCCGDGAVGTVPLIAGRTYKVAIALEDGQGGSSVIGRFALPGVTLTPTDYGNNIVDPSDPAQAGYWSYDVPNQVVVDSGAELDIQAINGNVDVLVNGHLEFDGAASSSINFLRIGAGAIVEVGAGPPAALGEDLGGAAAVPEPGCTLLSFLGLSVLASRRRHA